MTRPSAPGVVGRKLYPEKLNRWFDRLPEPKRFALFLLLMLPIILTNGIAPLWLNAATLAYGCILGILRCAYLCDLRWTDRLADH